MYPIPVNYSSNATLLTFCLFINYFFVGYVFQKGGVLKLYPGGGEKAVRILPILDRLLLFWSDRRNPHEVEPSHDIR